MRRVSSPPTTMNRHHHRVISPPSELLVGIDHPHHHDVLCGRGVTTNRHPGNESFRSLVSLNKELYVTSTKRQKMSISRSIVDAVRSMNPPGRFLEKNPSTGLWSDIGDRKAIEKTSQALRDGAAGLRKELTNDLTDPDFLSAVFEVETSLKDSTKSSPKDSTKGSAKDSSKEKVKPVKGKPPKKAHKARSNPMQTSKISTIRPPSTVRANVSSTSPGFSERPHDVPSLPKHTPVSPHSLPCSPKAGWGNHYRGNNNPVRIAPPHLAPESPRGNMFPPARFKGYHGVINGVNPGCNRIDSYRMPRRPHPLPPPPPHWPHGVHRYPGAAASSPPMVRPPQSPLPPGCHQFSSSGYVSKPPLSPRYHKWSSMHGYQRHPPHSHPGQRDYMSARHPEWWGPHESESFDTSRNGLSVPNLDGDDKESVQDESEGGNMDDTSEEHSRLGHYAPDRRIAQEFTPPRQRRKPTSPDVVFSDAAGVRKIPRKGPEESRLNKSKNSVTTISVRASKASHFSHDNGSDDEKKDDRDSLSHPHDKSVGHSTTDDLCLSPLPLDREDAVSLMDLPDDILQLPISSCGPHDD